jgi:hypothetical protein
LERRDLLKATVLGGLVAPEHLAATRRQRGESRPPSPNDRIGIGPIGVGNFGTTNTRQFMSNPDVDIVTVCDGHRTNVVTRLGHIAYRVGRQLQWDGMKEVKGL